MYGKTYRLCCRFTHRNDWRTTSELEAAVIKMIDFSMARRSVARWVGLECSLKCDNTKQPSDERYRLLLGRNTYLPMRLEVTQIPKLWKLGDDSGHVGVPVVL